MGRSAFILLFVLASYAPLGVADAPPISDETVLDHGFRYKNGDAGEQRCAIAVSDTSVLFAYQHERGVRAYRRYPDGDEIDPSGHNVFSESSNYSPFDLSMFDGTGWKMAYLSTRSENGYRGLSIRNLDSETLESTMGDVEIVTPGAGYVRYPTISRAHDHHVVAWVKVPDADGSLFLTRVSNELEVLADPPYAIATELASDAIDLAMRETGGMIAWVSSTDELTVQPLDAGGAPTGEAQSIGGARSWPSAELAICPLGDAWLIAWTGPQSLTYAILNPSGVVQPPGVITLLPYVEAQRGLDVCSVDDVGLITWRNVGDLSIVAHRVSRNGLLIGDRITLDEHSPYDYDGPEEDDLDLRTLSCSWTGERFVAIWNGYLPYITSPSKETRIGPGKRDVWCWGGSPIRSQWLELDGTVQYSEPLIINQTSMPSHCQVNFARSDTVLAVLRDGYSHRYLHTVVLDQYGVPYGAPQRYETPAIHEGDCNIWIDEWDFIRGLHARSWDNLTAVLYGYSYNYSSEIGTWIEHEDVIVDIVLPDGSLSDRYAARVHWTGGEPAASATGFDAARGEDFFVVAYSAYRGDWWGGPAITPYVEAQQIRFDGAELHTWHVQSDSACSKPTIVSLNDRFLMLWLEQSSGLTTIQRAILDPDSPETDVIGTPLVPSFGTHGAPYLVPGSSQVLCVFPADTALGNPLANDPTGYDIYALRFDLAGEQLDPEPVALCRGSGNQGNVQGVWDTNQYFITWSNTDQGSEAIYGGRIDSEGVTYDGDGFLIADGFAGSGQVSSDDVGNVAMAYGSQRVRLIEDLVPMLDDDYWPFDDDMVEPDTTTAAAIRIGHPAPNPSTGHIHLDLDLPGSVVARVTVLDVLGRRLAVRNVTEGTVEAGFTWDGYLSSGERAPAGTYYLVVSVDGQRVVRRASLLR